jgi:hypothetical protein
MKKVLILVLITGIWLSLSGCNRDSKSYAPLNHENTRWVSEDPNIFFEVSEEFRELTRYKTYGQISIDGEITEIVVCFDHGVGMYVFELLPDGNREHLFGGLSKFYPDKLEVNKINNGKEVFGKSVKKITFFMEPIRKEHPW